MTDEAALRAVAETAQRTAYRVERQINKLKTAELPGMTDDELAAAYKDGEHDPESDGWRHPDDCWRCAAYELLSQREAERDYVVLGKLPGPQSRYVTIPIVDLEELTHYLMFSLPGTGDFVSFYVQVTKVERVDADQLLVTVKICNGEQEWTFPYHANEMLRVIELKAAT